MASENGVINEDLKTNYTKMLIYLGKLYNVTGSPVYTTENFWHGSGENGTGPTTKGVRLG